MNSKLKASQKIKKLLALSKSCNKHEAALALQRAQELMAKYNISALDVELSSIKEVASKAGTKNNIPRWKCDLAHVIADAFGVSFFQAYDQTGTTVVFIGIDAYADISSYAFTVLRRQLEKARREHMNSISKRYKQSNRTRKADLFARAWVHAVNSKVNKFATSIKTQELIDTYLAEKHPSLRKFKPKSHQPKLDDYRSVVAGKNAAHLVTLNHGMRDSDRTKAIT